MYRVENSKGIVPVLACSLKAAAISSALVLGGCATYDRDHFKVSSVPSDYRTRHPIVVSQSETAEDLIVTSDMRGMSFRQRNVVLSFISRFRRSGAKQMYIMTPAGTPNEAAARRVAHDIVQFMKDERVKQGEIVVTRYHAADAGDSDTLRLTFSSVGAHLASECGKWGDDLGETAQNENYGNFGCATQNNLAQMIANPEDLISPRGESEIDAERRDSVITDWRENGTDSLPSLL